MQRREAIDGAIRAFEEKSHELCIFMNGIEQWFASHPKLQKAGFPVVHSVKSRLKDSDHLREKLARKWDDSNPTCADNIFSRITDLAGVRVLHLYQDQFTSIHREIVEKVETLKDWHLPEAPRAYTWDPESRLFFENLGIDVQIKESFYTASTTLCGHAQTRQLL